MGTRSLIILRSRNSDGTFTVWTVIYNQWDGGPDTIGRILYDLLVKIRLTNGFNPYEPSELEVANGFGDLCARVVAHFKIRIPKMNQDRRGIMGEFQQHIGGSRDKDATPEKYDWTGSCYIYPPTEIQEEEWNYYVTYNEDDNDLDLQVKGGEIQYDGKVQAPETKAYFYPNAEDDDQSN